MKRVFHYLFHGIYVAVELLLAFIVLYFLLYLSGGMIPTGYLKTEGELYFYVKSNGVHTDLCLPFNSPVYNWGEFISLNDYPKENYSFVSFGWGDKGFYLDTPEWSDLKFSTAFNAIFLNSETTMHVTCHSFEPAESDRCIKVYVDRPAYQNLVDYVKSSFQLEEGNVKRINHSGYSSVDQFYEGVGKYNLFRTCNLWTNKALKVGGVRTGIYALSAEGIMSHLKP